MKFKKYNDYISISSQSINIDTNLTTDIFELNKKWYIKCDISHVKHQIADLDNKCAIYASKKGLFYRSCIFENSILIKIPFRYKKFEARCENCTFYDLNAGHYVHVSFLPISISEFKPNEYTCCFKLIQIKLHSSLKHSHAPLECEEDAIGQ